MSFAKEMKDFLGAYDTTYKLTQKDRELGEHERHNVRTEGQTDVQLAESERTHRANEAHAGGTLAEQIRRNRELADYQNRSLDAMIQDRKDRQEIENRRLDIYGRNVDQRNKNTTTDPLAFATDEDRAILGARPRSGPKYLGTGTWPSASLPPSTPFAPPGTATAGSSNYAPQDTFSPQRPAPQPALQLPPPDPGTMPDPNGPAAVQGRSAGGLINRPNRTPFYQVGGPVADDDYDEEMAHAYRRAAPDARPEEEDQAYDEEMAHAVRQSAIPTGPQQPMPMPVQPMPQQALPVDQPAGAPAQPAEQPAEPNRDLELAKLANHDAMKVIQERYNMGLRGIETPESTHGRRAAFSGEDGADAADVEKMIKMVDPEKKLTRGQAMLRGYAAGYRHFLDAGDEPAAKRFAAGFIMYAQDQAAIAGNEVLSRLRKGDAKGAAEYAQKAYSFVPDGRDVEITEEKGKPVYTLRNDKGEVIEREVLSPQQLAGAAMGMANGSMFYDALARATNLHREKEVAGPSPAFIRAQEALKNYDTQMGERSSQAGIMTPEEEQQLVSGKYKPTQGIPTEPKLSASERAQMTPAERKQLEESTGERAARKEATRAAASADAKVQTPHDRETHVKMVNEALDTYFKPVSATEGGGDLTQDEMNDINKQKRQLSRYKPEIHSGVSQFMLANPRKTPQEAMEAVASVIDVDAAKPDQKSYSIVKDGNGNIVGIQYGRGRSMRASAEEIVPLITLRNELAAKQKKDTERTSREGPGVVGPMVSGLNAMISPSKGPRGPLPPERYPGEYTPNDAYGFPQDEPVARPPGPPPVQYPEGYTPGAYGFPQDEPVANPPNLIRGAPKALRHAMWPRQYPE